MEKLICTCENFKKNVWKLDDISVQMFIMSPLEENFVSFRYCPWCGFELHTKEWFDNKENIYFKGNITGA